MRRNTMNLDSRRNIFFCKFFRGHSGLSLAHNYFDIVGASIHQLYKENKWALLPDDETIYKYFIVRGKLARPRGAFPILQVGFSRLFPCHNSSPSYQETSFQYKLIPLQDMEEVYITRQSNILDHSDRGTIDIHHYPYENLPPLTCHIDPKYAIAKVGLIIAQRSHKEKQILFTKYPILRCVDSLFTFWTTHVPAFAKEETSYLPPEQLSSSRPPSIADSDCTPRHRIHRQQLPEDQSSSTSNSSSPPCSQDNQGDAEAHVASNASKRRAEREPAAPYYRRRRRPTCRLTLGALQSQGDEESEAESWTSQRIRDWAEQCPRNAAPTPVPPPPTRTKKPRRQHGKKR